MECNAVLGADDDKYLCAECSGMSGYLTDGDDPECQLVN
jgi:hypothetical protein